MSETKILLYNRERRAIEEEPVFERYYMDLLYGTPPGRVLARVLSRSRWFSNLYGTLQRRPKSVEKIGAFIKQHHINVDEIDMPSAGFRSFNDFFTRTLRPSARPINPDPSILISPADSRLIAYPLQRDTVLSVKGFSFTLPELLRNHELARPYAGGTCLVFRLAPMDCHRFYYIDDGYHDAVVPVGGNLHSVSPLAVRHKADTLQNNYRQYCVLHTRNFGAVLHIDVGALTVGTIHQHLEQGGSFSRGQEKGVFAFGGSTIVLIFKPGTVIVDDDIAEYSRQGIETLVHYGSEIAKAIPSEESGR